MLQNLHCTVCSHSLGWFDIECNLQLQLSPRQYLFDFLWQLFFISFLILFTKIKLAHTQQINVHVIKHPFTRNITAYNDKTRRKVSLSTTIVTQLELQSNITASAADIRHAKRFARSKSPVSAGEMRGEGSIVPVYNYFTFWHKYSLPNQWSYLKYCTVSIYFHAEYQFTYQN